MFFQNVSKLAETYRRFFKLFVKWFRTRREMHLWQSLSEMLLEVWFYFITRVLMALGGIFVWGDNSHSSGFHNLACSFGVSMGNQYSLPGGSSSLYSSSSSSSGSCSSKYVIVFKELHLKYIMSCFFVHRTL
jgi:hypothetical protein